MQIKNIEKRQEIMQISFQKYSELDYKEVFLKDIAEAAGITKSMLQHYYPHKYSIMMDLINELLINSFAFMDTIIEGDTNTHIKLAAYTMTLWNAADNNRKLDMLMCNAFNYKDTFDHLFDHLMESIFFWLKDMRYRNNIKFELPTLRIALFFSISGGMKLYFKKDMLNLSVNYICRQISTSFMRILDCSPAEIDMNIQEAETIAAGVDIRSFYAYCKEKIAWFDI